MRIFAASTFAALMGSSAALAGDLTRGTIPYSALFEDGGYVELSFTHVAPDVSGDYPAALGGGGTENLAKAYTNYGLTIKADLTDKLSLGIFLNQPYGANADYTNGAYTGLSATWESRQIAGILKYQATDRISVYGGARLATSDPEIAIPDALLRPGVQAGANQADQAATALESAGDPRAPAARAQADQLAAVAASPSGALDYTADTKRNSGVAYVVGAAYEIPDIALRLGLTYDSGFTYDFDTHEVLPGFGVNANTTTSIEMPQSLKFDFQTGVAPGTLVFGSVKWAEWSKWQVRPPEYSRITGERVTGIDNDTWTYQVGVGRQFSDTFSGFAQASYVPSHGGEASRLDPTNGRLSLGVGGTYSVGATEVKAGVEYIKLGDATDASEVEFKDNSALGLGMSVGFRF